MRRQSGPSAAAIKIADRAAQRHLARIISRPTACTQIRCAGAISTATDDAGDLSGAHYPKLTRLTRQLDCMLRSTYLGPSEWLTCVAHLLELPDTPVFTTSMSTTSHVRLLAARTS